MQPKFDQFLAGQISAFKGVLKILDTIDTKEVDLENSVKGRIAGCPVHNLEMSFAYDGEYKLISVKIELVK